jgi:hypothetical protein
MMIDLIRPKDQGASLAKNTETAEKFKNIIFVISNAKEKSCYKADLSLMFEMTV